MEEQIAEKEQMLKTLDADLSTYQGQREKAYDLLERGVYTIEVFQQRQKTLQDTISRLEASRDELLADMRNINQIQEEQEAYIPKIRNLLENYRTNTPETNNRILKEVIDRMLYEKTEPNRRGQLNNCNFSLEVYPKLPR